MGHNISGDNRLLNHHPDPNDQVRDLLMAHPEGLNIKEIASCLGINRNLASKYLGVLRSQGYVTSRKYSTAIIYSISTRIPVAPLLAYSIDPVVIIGNNLIIVDCNPQFTDLFSIPRDTFVGKSIADIREMLFLDPDHMDLLQSVLQSEVRVTTVRISREEPLFAAMVTFLPAIFMDGRPGVALIIRDITAVAVLEKRLKELEVKYETSLSTMGGFVIDLDHNGALTNVNEEYCTYIGKTTTDILAHYDLPFTFIDDRTQFSTLLSTLNYEIPTASADTRSIDQDGDIRWERWNVHALLSREGVVIGYRLTGHEITSFKRTEEQLKSHLESLEKLVRERTETLRNSNAELMREIESHEKVERKLKLTQYAMDESAEMILWFNNKGRIVYANHASCKMLGYSRDEFTHLAIEKVVSPQDKDISRESVLDFLINAGKYEPLQMRGSFQGKGGHTIHVDIHFTYVEYAEIPVTLCTARDITAQIVAEHRAHESETTYRLLVETLQEGVWAIDADGYTTFVNPHMAAMLGYSAEEMKGRHLFSFMNEGRVDAAKRNIERRREGISEDHEFDFTRKDGSQIIASLKTSPIRDSEGNYIGAIAGVTDITKQKRMEELVHNANTYYRALIEASLDPFVTIFPDGMIGDVNEATVRITGYSREELIGTNFSQYFTDSEHALQGYEKVFRDGLIRDYELTIRHRNGTVSSVLYNAVVFRDESGVITGIFATARDITKRKVAEEALRESEERFRTVADFTYDWEYWVGPNSEILYISPSCERITGYSQGELYEKQLLIYEIVHPADKEFFSHHCELCNTEEKSYEIEFRIVRKDGTVAWVSHACRPVQGKGGLRLGRRVSNREITDRKRIETILQESEERYRTVVNAITENLSVIDSEGKFLFANHQATRNISRGSFSDITGRNIWEFVPPDIADQIIENYRRVITSGQPFECEVRVILGGKERWFYNHLIPFTFQPGEQRCVLSVSFDITDQKRTEEALDLARKKLHVLHEMTVNEITEAIFAQKGYLELAKRLNKDSNLVLYLDRQTQNIEKISAILSFCSNYQDLGASPPRWHDLHQTFLLALSHLPMPALTRHIDLDGLEIYADPFLEKVLVVLVENVLFYAPTATMLSLTHRETGEELVVTIEDDGPGIPTEEKEKIFERGFGKNTGLGLFLSREILSITGITICETGEPCKGARFEVMVPEGMWRDSKRLPAALPVG